MKYDEIIELALKRGFFFQTAEIYHPISGFWDYGPNGASLKRKLIKFWREEVVRKNGFVEIDGSEILPEDVFKASGHLKNFVDPITECKKCGAVYRADKLIEEKLGVKVTEGELEKINRYLKKIKCPKCGGELSNVKEFNMMLKVGLGVNNKENGYLRPETCQNIFINFPRIFKLEREKFPIGIAQVGKSFRNEISPRRSIIRMREFTQAEVEIFFNKKDSKKIIENGLKIIRDFFDKLGLEYRLRELKEDKPFYSIKSFDLEVKTSVGWLEVVACNYRGDYDLRVHSKGSGKDIKVNGEIPHVFELSMGIDRLLFAMLDKYWKKEGERTVLKIPNNISPISVAVFPLVNKKEFVEKAKEVFEKLSISFDCFYDDKGSIGRRYRRQDEIGTPICITIDGQTLEDNTVTLRDRDSMKQKRVKVKDLKEEISKLLVV